MHEYYHSEGVTDLQAIRLEANRRLTDKRWPEESIIHLHPKTEQCEVNKHEHVQFAAPAGLEVPEQKAEAEEQGKLDTWNDQEHDGPTL